MVITIASTGQSNAVGRGAGGWPSSIFDSRIRVWNNIADNGGDGSAFVAPNLGQPPFHTKPNGQHAQNISLAFAHRVAQETQANVRLLHIGKGGTPFQMWVNGEGEPTPMSDALVRNHQLSGCDPVTIMMHAGHEANVDSDYDTQRNLFLSLFSRYESEGVCDCHTIYLLTGTAEVADRPNRAEYNKNVLRRLADENPRIFYADSEGLQTYDGTHYTGEDLIRMGYERSWDAAAHLLPSVVSTGPDVVVDSGRDVRGEWYNYSSGRRECFGIAYLKVVNSRTAVGSWKFPGGQFISMPLGVSHTIIGDAMSYPRTMETSDANWLQINARLVDKDGLQVRMRNINQVTPFTEGDYLVLSMYATGRWK